MLAPRFRFTTRQLFYLASLLAASLSLCGSVGMSWLGIAVTAFATLVWWQILVGAKRELLLSGHQQAIDYRKKVQFDSKRSLCLQFIIQRATPAEGLGAMVVFAITTGLLLPTTDLKGPRRPHHFSHFNDRDFEQYSRLPEIGDGSWERGFFVSVFHSRLATDPDNVSSCQLAETQKPFSICEPGSSGTTVVALVGKIPDASVPRVIHYANIFRLFFFVLVVIYPIRWLHQLRCQYS